MVFATEFDPREQSQRRARTQSAQQMSQPISAVSLQEISALEESLKGSSPVSLARPLARHKRTGAASNNNVVSLQIGRAAKRVRLDTNATLSLPQQPNLPLGLRLLTRLQQGSTAITGLLVTAALLVYGSTVYVDKSTTRAIVQLDELQGESQQLTSANESIKQSLAEQATRPDSGLEPYEAGDLLFVEPAPVRQKAVEDAGEKAAEQAEMSGPLGY